MTTSLFGGAIAFLNEVGVYDVVLPFLLVFSLVFALLDKTRILGVEYSPDGKTKYPKKNLNSMIAFVIAFFVVASSQLVALINKTLGQIFILLLMGTMFMLVAGSFKTDGEFDMDSKLRSVLTIVSGIVIVLIFLYDVGWLTWLYNFLKEYGDTSVVSSIIMLILIAGFMYFMTSSSRPKTNSDNK